MNAKFLKEYGAARSMSAVRAREDVGRVVVSVCRDLARKMRFGYHTREDIEHEGVVIALEVLRTGKYDVRRPLANFLYSHVRNQLLNLKRKQLVRSERPCDCCEPFGTPDNPCGKWLAWSDRNARKQNLMSPVDVESVADAGEENMRRESTASSDLETKELVDRIDAGLPAALRSDYLKLRDGVAIPKARRAAVQDAVRKILDAEAGGEEQE